MSSSTSCPKCGWIMRVGDWPFCGTGRDHRPAVANVIGDSIPGGLVIENLGHDAMTFYSKKAILEEADRRGLRLRDQWAGPSDKYLTNWAAGIDAKTLDDKRVLLSRGATSAAQEQPEGRLETLVTEVREVTSW